MLSPVCTQWNSMAEAIDRALSMRPALDKLVELSHHNTGNAKTHLQSYKLTAEEWRIFEELCPLLKVRLSFKVDIIILIYY